MQAAPQIELDIIYKMMAAFASSSDINATILQGLTYVKQACGAEAASFFALDSVAQKLTCTACLGPVDIKGLSLSARAGVVGNVVQSGQARLITDVASAPDFDNTTDAKTGFVTKSIICAPVAGNGTTYGAMQLINRTDANGIFSDNDAVLLSLLGQSAALALANSQMAAAMVEARLMKRDLAIAARVQQNLFPSDKFDYVHGITIPQKGVSGDLFDYARRNGQLYFCVGDVSGKGIDAALVMSKTHSLFRSLSRIHSEIGALTAAINRELFETALDGMFVTAIIGRYDPQSGAAQICNAGHEAGLLIAADGTMRDIAASLHPLGISDFGAGDNAVEELSLAAARFFCFSDGMTEAEIDGHMVGRAHIRALLRAHMGVELHAQIASTVEALRGTADPLTDDVTLFGLGQAAPLAAASALFKVSIDNKIPELRRLRRTLAASLQPRLSAERIADIGLVLSEATQNIIRHAYRGQQDGRIEISGHWQADQLTITLDDTAAPIDLAQVQPRALDDLREGGLGTHFIREMTREAEWSHIDGGNRLRLIFDI